MSFFERWAEHTRDFVRRDHPYITKIRLLLIAGDTPYVGIAENHWPDLQEFMDPNGSPTVVVQGEVDVSPAGIVQLFPSPPPAAP